MNLIIRMYWQYDLDLLSLHAHPDFSLSQTMKDVLKAYTRGETYSIPLPSPQPFKTTLTNCTIHIYLNPKKDGDVIKMLNGFRTGMRNTALKNLYRAYLEAPRMDPFFNDAMYEVKSRSKPEKKKSSTKPVQGKRFSRPNIEASGPNNISVFADNAQENNSNAANNTPDYPLNKRESSAMYSQNTSINSGRHYNGIYNNESAQTLDLRNDGNTYTTYSDNDFDDDFDFDALIQGMIDAT